MRKGFHEEAWVLVSTICGEDGVIEGGADTDWLVVCGSYFVKLCD